MRKLAAVWIGAALAGAALPAAAAPLPHYSDGRVTCPNGTWISYQWSAPGWISQPPASQMKSACEMAESRRRMAGAATMHSNILGGRPMTSEDIRRQAAPLIGTQPK